MQFHIFHFHCRKEYLEYLMPNAIWIGVGVFLSCLLLLTFFKSARTKFPINFVLYFLLVSYYFPSISIITLTYHLHPAQIQSQALILAMLTHIHETNVYFIVLSAVFLLCVIIVLMANFFPVMDTRWKLFMKSH